MDFQKLRSIRFANDPALYSRRLALDNTFRDGSQFSPWFLSLFNDPLRQAVHF